MVMQYIVYLIRAGIIYYDGYVANERVLMFLFSWPENTLKQTADRVVILDPLLLSYFWQNCEVVVA